MSVCQEILSHATVEWYYNELGLGMSWKAALEYDKCVLSSLTVLAQISKISGSQFPHL